MMETAYLLDPECIVLAGSYLNDRTPEELEKLKTLWDSVPVPAGPFREWRISVDYGTANPASFGLWGRQGETWYRVGEYYYDSRREGRQKTDAEYADMLERLEAHYGVKPILYVTYRSYYRYIAGGGYGDYPIWCSSPTVFPLVPGWDFWQYSHSAELEGYYGTQRRIDLNIFRGSQAEFERFG